MLLFYVVLFLLVAGGVTALLQGRGPQACRTASRAVIAACAAGFAFSLNVLASGVTLSSHLPVPLPFGRVLFAVDPTAAAFLLPVFLISGLGAALMPARMQNLPAHAHCGRHSFFFCMLILGMVLVISAADSVFFLVAWEGMSLAPFFLAAPEDARPKDREALWLYVVVAHIGALPLLFLFASLSVEAGGTAFARIAAMPVVPGAELLFIAALIGFGAKIGLMPLHIWMPEAYPAAPGHVAAVMSGAMINAGVYGLVRVLGLLGPIETWQVFTLMGVGSITGLAAGMFAMTQPCLKRSLAYSSAENMGLILLGLGSGIFALQKGFSLPALLLFSGTFLHMWNHALFKSLFFVGASAVEQSTGTTLINRLGGLQKRMPYAAACLAVASAAISGLPPLNGFVGELLLYLGLAGGGLAAKGSPDALVFWGFIFIPAGIAGISLICFTRAYGLIFLGAARSASVSCSPPAENAWRSVMGILVALCFAAALAAPLLFSLLEPVLYGFSLSLGQTVNYKPEDFASAAQTLRFTALGCGLLLAALGLAWFFVSRRVRRNGAEKGLTWDCGYIAPTSRMQYTGGSFAQFPALVARAVLRPRMETPGLNETGGLFPQSARARMDVPDWPLNALSRLVNRLLERPADAFKSLQHGLLNAYILYILVALVAALVFALAPGGI